MPLLVRVELGGFAGLACSGVSEWLEVLLLRGRLNGRCLLDDDRGRLGALRCLAYVDVSVSQSIFVVVVD